jgi:hypothetical protein
MLTLMPSRSYPLFLEKKCSYAKALFVTILLSWVGLVAVFLSQLPQHHINDNNAEISPLNARDNPLHLLRSPSFSQKNSIGGGKELVNHRSSRKMNYPNFQNLPIVRLQYQHTLLPERKRASVDHSTNRK